MKNILLGIIAINLTFISANLALRSVEPIKASEYDITNALNSCSIIAGQNWYTSNGRRGGFNFVCD